MEPAPPAAIAPVPQQDAATPRDAGNTPAEALAGDLSAPAAPSGPAPSAASVIAHAAYGAGKLDNELRGGKLAKLNKQDAALRANVDAAFRDAVARKWFEPASIQEISTPSDRVRVYKMKTLMGTVLSLIHI